MQKNRTDLFCEIIQIRHRAVGTLGVCGHYGEAGFVHSSSHQFQSLQAQVPVLVPVPVLVLVLVLNLKGGGGEGFVASRRVASPPPGRPKIH